MVHCIVISISWYTPRKSIRWHDSDMQYRCVERLKQYVRFRQTHDLVSCFMARKPLVCLLRCREYTYLVISWSRCSNTGVQPKVWVSFHSHEYRLLKAMSATAAYSLVYFRRLRTRIVFVSPALFSVVTAWRRRQQQQLPSPGITGFGWCRRTMSTGSSRESRFASRFRTCRKQPRCALRSGDTWLLVRHSNACLRQISAWWQRHSAERERSPYRSAQALDGYRRLLAMRSSVDVPTAVPWYRWLLRGNALTSYAAL